MKSVVVKPKGLRSACIFFDNNAYVFCEECCSIFHELTMDADTNIRNVATDLQDCFAIQLNLCRRGLVHRSCQL